MSFHAGQTFTFGEQPSATKWQYLWDNDYALADGSGISNDAILTRHILNNNVTAAKLATNAIKLGKADIASASVTLNTSYADLTSVTVTVPSGGRDVLILVNCPQVQGSAGTERMELRIMEGSTILERYYHGAKNPGMGALFAALVPAPSAGSHTYKFNGKMDIGSSGLIYSDNSGSTFQIAAYAV